MEMSLDYWLPVFFVSVMGFALLVYVILDGYDLGIGMLLPLANERQKDQMIAAIGPFWDANETWIVLGVGVLLIAFPKAHGIILTALYLPVTIMLIGLVLRGVAFDFRVKANIRHKSFWNATFFIGSITAAMAQGWMLGSYVTGLEESAINTLFSLAIALALPALYIMLGCGWLLIKSTGDLFEKAVSWARMTLLPMGVGILLISMATPLVSASIAQKWFSLPAAIGLLPIPITTLIAFASVYSILRRPRLLAVAEWSIFLCMVIICVMSALGLAYSIFPDIIINRLDIWETAASTPSLSFVFVGVALTVPMILVYTIFVYRIFSGKATDLSYE
jgi:cytochrome d ubiquinol oxidase subunit II